MRKFLIFLIFICLSYPQTNITTPMGSTGFGVWTTLEQNFRGDDLSLSLICDLHLMFGLELSVGKSVASKDNYSYNQIGIAYDLKLYDWGSKIYGKRFAIDESAVSGDGYDFMDSYNIEELGLEFYRRGRKLNSFVKLSNINDKSLPVEYYDTFVTVGGVGRMTRFITMGFGIRVPIENLFHMRYSSIEITMGTSF